MAEERLQKIVSGAGLTSRRKAEDWIAAGRVAVNGEVVREVGAKADPETDRITVDGRPLPAPRPRHLAVHKPPGVLCALADDFGRPLISELCDGVPERIYPAGRLDLDSEGLVLMTNDGELMDAVTRAGGTVPKVYRVEVEGRPVERDLAQLRRGIELDGRPTLPCAIRQVGTGDDAWYRAVLHEGRKNQLRRMFESIGHPVTRLVRLAIGPVRLGGLEPGAYRDLEREELEELRRQAGLEGGDGAEGGVDGEGGAG